MNRQLRRIIFTTIALLAVTLLFSFNDMRTTHAATNIPDYYGYLSPTKAYVDTYRVTLTIDGLGGVNPPSSNWYDPHGNQVSCCSGGRVVRDYVYSYGSLVQVKDYFYIAGLNREPGQYSVRVGWEIDKTFTINTRTYYVYLPVIQR